MLVAAVLFIINGVAPMEEPPPAAATGAATSSSSRRRKSVGSNSDEEGGKEELKKWLGLRGGGKSMDGAGERKKERV